MTDTGEQRNAGQLSDERIECRFCAIVRGEAPACVVFENDTVFAFLDRRPLFPGHILLVPREHYATLGDLPETLITPLFVSARLLATAVEQALEADGTFMAMNNRVSQSVPHLHIHIVPRRRHDGLKGFFWPRHSYSDEAEISSIGGLIRSAVTRLEEGAAV
ncbi:MAG: HIT family hydrolase [Geobacteraceae bacterium GWC2_58_44]|nr:MAG: HIT family hydrolase [Geobacteraceae bacterium GWC2_58_44]HBG05689.1 HIT family protein [Geobacter sp.]